MSVFTLRDMAFLVGNQSSVGGDETWTPAEITTALWLDAADSTTLFDATIGGSLVVDGGTVRRWEDKSGNSRHATNNTGPTYSAANKKLQFNGFTYLTTSPGWGNYWELIAVIKFDRTDPFVQLGFKDDFAVAGDFSFGTAIAGYNNNSTFFYRIRETPSGLSTSLSSEFGITTRLVGFSSRTTNRGVVYRDGVQRVDFAVSGGVRPNICLGVNGLEVNSGQGLQGSFSEFILLPTEADTNTRQKLEGYLAHKWGLTANLPSHHPYKAVAP